MSPGAFHRERRRDRRSPTKRQVERSSRSETRRGREAFSCTIGDRRMSRRQGKTARSSDSIILEVQFLSQENHAVDLRESRVLLGCDEQNASVPVPESRHAPRHRRLRNEVVLAEARKDIHADGIELLPCAVKFLRRNWR